MSPTTVSTATTWKPQTHAPKAQMGPTSPTRSRALVGQLVSLGHAEAETHDPQLSATALAA
eukprot:6630064-Pyramimonas_sp.AAC.1